MPKDKSAKAKPRKSAQDKAPKLPPQALADPNTLPPLKHKSKDSTTGTAHPGAELLQVVIETPRGSHNKYSYDEDQHLFVLKAALPAGMVFPYDFGFLPQTVGGDGDPLDVLVLMDEPCFPGCALLARLIGVMECDQTQAGETTRNDRLLAVAETSHLYAKIQTVDDLPKRARVEIEQFFSNYHKLQKKKSKLLAWKGPKTARRLIDQGVERARQQDETPDNE